MDGGPFRMTQPADRRAVSRPEQARRMPEESQSVPETPKTVHRAPTSSQGKSPTPPARRFKLPLIIIGTILGIGAAWFVWTNMHSAGLAIDTNKYQAVFFTNGQVYFGKLQPVNGEYIQLTDIYYLQTQSGSTDSKNPQETTSDNGNVQLIKLGDEVHGPEDKMIISKDQVLFYENLKSDGKVAQSISKYKKP